MGKKSKRLKRSIKGGTGKPCPKCSKPMERTKHGPTWKPKKNQPYYFSYWDRCRKCRHIQLYEVAKVHLIDLVLSVSKHLDAEYRNIMGRE